MPVCFQLFRKGSASPQKLSDVDTAICAYLEEPVHDMFWAHGWYDFIGFHLACGDSFEKIAERIHAAGPLDDRTRAMLRINHFLMENYTVDSWREWKS
jgi:hypothetical protein